MTTRDDAPRACMNVHEDGCDCPDCTPQPDAVEQCIFCKADIHGNATVYSKGPAHADVGDCVLTATAAERERLMAKFARFLQDEANAAWHQPKEHPTNVIDKLTNKFAAAIRKVKDE